MVVGRHIGAASTSSPPSSPPHTHTFLHGHCPPYLHHQTPPPPPSPPHTDTFPSWPLPGTSPLPPSSLPSTHTYLSIVAVARHVAAADRNGILHVLQHAQHHAAIGRHPAAAAHKHKRARAVSAAAIAPAAAADDDAVKVERGSRATLGAHRHTGHCPAVKRGQRQPGVHARRQLQLQLRLGACRRRRRQCHWLARALFTLQLQEETATPCRSAAAQHDCDVVRPTRRRRQPCLLSWRQLLATAAVVGGKAHKRVAAGRHVQNLDAGQLQRTGGAGARLDVDAAQRAEVGQLRAHDGSRVTRITRVCGEATGSTVVVPKSVTLAQERCQ
eukprot:361083-Chlamydomonas_euryale.AAC.3